MIEGCGQAAAYTKAKGKDCMYVAEILDRVRLAIDEQMANDSGFLSESSDEQNLTNIILSKIFDGVVFIIENAPIDKFDSSLIDTNTHSPSGTVLAGGCVKVELDATVLRVVSARLSSWFQSPMPVSESSPEYLMQGDGYAKGSWDRPVVAITYRNGKRYVELYSAKTSSDTVELTVIKKPTIASVVTMQANPASTEIAVPTLLESAFIYQVAGLSMLALREETATALLTIARQYLTNQQLSV